MQLCQHETVSSTDCQTPLSPLPNPSPHKSIPRNTSVHYSRTWRATLQGAELDRLKVEKCRLERGERELWGKRTGEMVSSNEELGEGKERYMEEGPDVDVSLRFYQRYLLISFTSITASSLFTDGCRIDDTRAGTPEHTHTHTKHTHLFIRSAAIGLCSF